MKNKILPIIGGLVFTFIGCIAIIDDGVPYRGSFIFGWVGYPLAFVGLWFFYAAFVAKADKPENHAALCPQCGTANPKEQTGQPCPKCGAPLEPVEGFYERHPELRRDPLEGEDVRFDK